MKNKLRSLTALLAVVLCVSVFSIPAYAQSSDCLLYTSNAPTG